MLIRGQTDASEGGSGHGFKKVIMLSYGTASRQTG